MFISIMLLLWYNQNYQTMKNHYSILILLLTFLSCKEDRPKTIETFDTDKLTIAFGSCNNQLLENKLWDDVLAQHPDIWIWGGDVVYSDTDDPEKMKADYQTQINQKEYQDFIKQVKVLGTWDDHDYGVNDGGNEFVMKSKSQQLFLDFLGVSDDDVRRDREGIYCSKVIKTNSGSVKIIVLDTRYFRTALTPSTIKGKRYQHNKYGEGTILGESQWQWLEQELQSFHADFNIIVSSIQVLSNEHGFETWGHFPHELDKLKKLLIETKTQNVIVLSGDRHISEFSQETVFGLKHPIIDFTSSGMTHSYDNFVGEKNPYRIGRVVSDKSFGVLKIDLKTKTVIMEMRGDNNLLQQKMKQSY